MKHKNITITMGKLAVGGNWDIRVDAGLPQMYCRKINDKFINSELDKEDILYNLNFLLYEVGKIIKEIKEDIK